MESGEFVVISDYDVRMKQEKRWSLLSQLLADPILADALRNPTLSYVVTLVSLEKGSAMRLSIVKLDGSSLGNVLLYWHFVEHLVCIVDLHLFFSFGRCGGYEFSYFEGSEDFLSRRELMRWSKQTWVIATLLDRICSICDEEGSGKTLEEEEASSLSFTPQDLLDSSVLWKVEEVRPLNQVTALSL
ncbi:PREDICTED: uncharacterized protein LOC106301326 isoform X2 [Brassica oleracea var. oleracea]|uniref:uncharacterized protein LOC106301326 isoform X2 n=1 Tax=Brassica oleracea var. oleracea TaxID=109376 RepID=UPI0006A746F8|nr:PREDICTED: uncharacterized protein LOC106301326 isoform X2 [Brassica oleracea var. oleracea]